MLYHEIWFAGYSGIMLSAMTIGASVEIHDKICWDSGHKNKMIYYDKISYNLPPCVEIPLLTFPFAIAWPVWLVGAPIGSAIYYLKKK